MVVATLLPLDITQSGCTHSMCKKAVDSITLASLRESDFLDFSGPRKKWAGRAPNGAGNIVFRLKKIFPTFWAERILILRIFIFWIFWVPKFWLGPTHLGPTWAHPLGPHVGPPTWAPRGPTHVGPPTRPHVGPSPTWAHPLGPHGWAGGPLGWAPRVGIPYQN